MIFVNFKTYQEGSGSSAVSLAQLIEETALNYGIKVAIAVAASDIKEIAATSKLEVWAQKIDPVEFGAHTGAVLAEAVFEDGARGTFLNHSENKFTDFELLKKAKERAEEIGLKTLIFASDVEEFTKVLTLNPTYISYEPAELIGSTTVSVVSAKPEIISQVSVLSKEAGIPLIVGAGVHSGEDVKKSIELGASGVAVATDVVKAQNPRQELSDLLEGFR